MNESLRTAMTTWVSNPDLQAVILLGLTCIGAWVVLTWIFCFIFTIIWPLLVILGMMIVCPDFTRAIVNHVIPKYAEMIAVFNRMLRSHNLVHTPRGQ